MTICFGEKTAGVHENLKILDTSSWKAKVGRRTFVALMDFASIAIFSLLTLGMIFLFFKAGGPHRTLAAGYLVVFVIIRSVRLIFRIFPAPSTPNFAITPLGEVIAILKVHSERFDDDVIDKDIIIFWGSQKRIITGADILGRLLRGIVQNQGAGFKKLVH